MTGRLIACLALIAYAAAGAAQEQAQKAADSAAARAIDTLQRIRETGAIPIGVRDASFPFSFVDERKQAHGYSIDLCLRIADAVKQELRLPRLEVKYVPVSESNQIAALVDRKIDLECGATSNTRERQQQVSFAYTTFVAGIRLLARKTSQIHGMDDLRGKTIVVTRGSASEKLVTRINEQRSLKMTILVADDHDRSFRAVDDGSAVAFPMDDVLLYGLIAKAKRPDDFAVVGKYLSVEPYAIMLRKGEPELEAIVDTTLSRLFASGEIREIYASWFATPELTVPMSPLLKEAFTAPNTYPAWP